MGDLKNAKLIYLKAVLFLICGVTAACTLVVRDFRYDTVFLVAITIWSFCRLYYFMFYVMQHYVDDTFRFSGIIPFIFYVMARKK